MPTIRVALMTTRFIFDWALLLVMIFIMIVNPTDSYLLPGSTESQCSYIKYTREHRSATCIGSVARFAFRRTNNESPDSQRSEYLSKCVQLIKEEVDIVDIVRRYTRVIGSYPSYSCVCPFHDDKNPSMSISSNSGLYNCFPCGEGGDTIRFIQRIEKLGFKKSVFHIMAMANLSLSDRGPSQQRYSFIYQLTTDSTN